VVVMAMHALVVGLIWCAIGLAVGSTIANIGGWYFLFHRDFGSPWNWRVLLGAKRYRAWEQS
jgi:hypothetical protein